jgi:hypothetical protein
MKLPIRHAHGLAALGLWGLAAVVAAAGPNSPLPDPADDRAPVPATRYQPLLTTSPSAAPASSPPDHWRALNREVASFDSMSLTMDVQGSTSARPEVPVQREQHEQHVPAPGAVPMPGTQPRPHAHLHREKK